MRDIEMYLTMKISKQLDKLKLKSQNAYRLSWDDKYTELCKKQNIEIFKQVKFGLPMPKIMDQKYENQNSNNIKKENLK